MRLPFLQVPQLDLSRGRTLARILRIPEAHGIGLTVALDAWAVDEAPEGDVSGLIRDANPAEAVALAVGWDGPHEQLLAALVRVKLVEETTEGPCVVSVRRYASALTSPTRRSEHASRAASVRWHGKLDAPGMGRALPDDAYTQTQTQTQKAEAVPPPSSSAPAGGVEVGPGVWQFQLKSQKPPRRVRKPKPEKPTDPRHAPLTQELCEMHGWPHHGGRTAKAISSLLELAARGGQREDAGYHEVVRRAVLARASEGFPRVRELHELVTHWGHFAEPQKRAAGPPRMDPNQGILRPSARACAGCDHDGDGARIGEPSVWLCYQCLGAWQDDGLHFTKAAEWAAARKKAA